MYTFLMIIHIFASLVLIFVILMQAGRGGGISEIFGGSTQTIFGTSATKFLMRATAVCAALFIITSLSLAALSAKRSRSLMRSIAAEPAAVTDQAADFIPEEAQEQTMPAEDEKKPIEAKPE